VTIAVYESLAAANGMKIVAVAETHIHADFLSGTRELGAATGASLYVSGEGGTDWQYGYDAERLNNGDVVTLGNITVKALHTPGHTPEHLSFLITDGAFANTPGYLLSGDFVFSGDLGRPDLLDEAAGGIDTRFVGAQQLFSSLRDKFLTLPDHVQVHPGHGAGSACGKALGALPSSTVGYERLYSWWGTCLATNDEEGFVNELLNGQPDAHAYFGRMKRENRDGPAVMGERAPLVELDLADVARDLDADTVTFVDTRNNAQVHEGTVTRSVNIPAGKSTASFGAWVVNPETDTNPLVLLAPNQAAAQELWDHLVRVGIDKIAGFVTSFDGLPTSTPKLIQPSDLDTVERPGSGCPKPHRALGRTHPRLPAAQRWSRHVEPGPAPRRRHDRQLLPERSPQLRRLLIALTPSGQQRLQGHIDGYDQDQDQDGEAAFEDPVRDLPSEPACGERRNRDRHSKRQSYPIDQCRDGEDESPATDQAK